MKHEHYDLVVAGTGFASSFFLSKYLSKAKADAKILVLEKGHLYPMAERLKIKRGEASAYQEYERPWENEIRNINKEKEWPFSTAYGGSSNCWWGCTPRFMPNDFKMKTKYGIADDWPINYNDLEPYYSEAEEIMSVSGPEFTPFPKHTKYPLPAHAFTLVDKILHKKYGNLYISQPGARASRATSHRNACMAFSSCETCPMDAKFTIENSGMGVYNDKRVELSYGAEVLHLETANDVVQKVIFSHGGRKHAIKAEVVALGTNPFFNTNILLRSGDNNALTGKGFGEQLGMQVHIYLDNMTNAGGSTWVNANGYMLYDGEHRKQHAACLIEANNAPFDIRLERGKHLNVASFRCVFEDLPNNKNYITTSADNLVPEVHFKERSSYALDGIENMKKQLPSILSCLPVEKLIFFDPAPHEGHILGGTRMSTSRNNGVVDKHLIHHQYRNLFVLGAGAFTTFGPSNPTLTLSALSLFAADKSF